MQTVISRAPAVAAPTRFRGAGGIVVWLGLFLAIGWLGSLPSLEPWQRMGLVAGALLLSFKTATWASAGLPAGLAWWLAPAWFLGWPGLDRDEFLRSRSQASASTAAEWMLAGAKMVAGVVLLWGMVRWIPAESPAMRGFAGGVGLLLLLHFGSFHLLALAWQLSGRDVRPIMERPLGSRSLADFWGNRWNRAYRRVSHEFFFRPVVSFAGPVAATYFAFLMSGLIHELAISIPAGGGFGLPTAYFLLQPCGLFIEKTGSFRALSRRHLWARRAWTALVVLLPVLLLFHPPFLTRVMVPLLEAMGCLS